ncbi:MAG TPA: basic amino acid ABC transporter substrate-binding protein [Candidatus Aphodousia gallistercoris]|nr:basic amino acid ABC transporter substrate-binding protein [Candidatus Aphodousia gallistercoris]
MQLKQTLKFAAFAVSAFGMVCSAQAADKVYQVGSNMAFAPFEFVEDGKPAGFDMDLIVAIMKTQGAEVQLNNLPFDGLIPALQAGTIDIAMSGMTITEERKKRVSFSEPYYDNGLVVLVRAADKDKFKSIDDIKGKTLCAQIGTTGAITAGKMSGKNVKLFNNGPEAFMELNNKGCDAVVHDKPVVNYYVAKRGDKDVVVLPGQLNSEQTGIAVAKDNKELLKMVNDGLKAVKENGEYDRLYKKWFGQ